MKPIKMKSEKREKEKIKKNKQQKHNNLCAATGRSRLKANHTVSAAN